MRTISRQLARTALAMLTLLLTSLTIVGVSSPAHAADYYRYWIYFQVADGKYVVSQTGFGGTTPTDGSIEAYRYAAPADYNSPNLPRVDLTAVTFDSVCGDTEPADGQKRVAVILDFGVEADAEGQAVPEPKAACAQVPAKATGLQVLDAVSDVRSETSSMGPSLCGIDGYPAKHCADVVTKTATPADDGFVEIEAAPVADDTDDTADDTADAKKEDDSKTGLYAGLGVLVLALLTAGAFVARRRNAA